MKFAQGLGLALAFLYDVKSQIFRTYALRSPNPLKKGALEVPPFLRGTRGDLSFRLQCVSPNFY
jgi:hypothetical protein